MRGLYDLKPWYTRRLDLFLRLAVRRGTSPDVFTAIGVASAAAAGVFIALGVWPAAAVALAGRLAGANLDGAVARARGVSRPWGFVLNEVGDRVSDLVMFAGLAVLAARVGPAGVTSTLALTGALGWVALAAVAATLPTTAALAGAGAGAARLNGGPFGKTERCAVVVAATALPAWIPALCAVIAAGSVLTAIVRLRRVRAALTPRR